MVRSVFTMSVLSVSSSSSRWAGTLWASRARLTSPFRSPSMSWRPATFRETCTGPTAECLHRLICWQTVSMTQVPTSTMRPDSSRAGMKTPGGTRPWPGRSHRSRASKPAMVPSSSLALGW